MKTRQPLIAVVDDDASIRRALLRLLRMSHYRAESFDSSIAFLESIVERMPDCVILDVQMPLMTGIEVQQRLLQIDRPPPVIIITAHDEPNTREQCLALGAVSYLRKPIDGDLLIDAIREAVPAQE